MGEHAERLALMVRSNRLRGPRRIPEALVLVVAALEEGQPDQLELALSTLGRRLDGVTDVLPRGRR